MNTNKFNYKTNKKEDIQKKGKKLNKTKKLLPKISNRKANIYHNIKATNTKIDEEDLRVAAKKEKLPS